MNRALLASVLIVLLGSCRQPAEEPVTLKYLRPGWVSPNELPAEAVLSHEFEHQTGLRLVHLRGVQENALDQLTLARKQLAEKASGPDVVELDVTWLSVVQNDLLDLRPLLGKDVGSIYPGLSASYENGSKLLAIPYQKAVGVLKFRSDLLAAYGYRHPPRSWDELEIMAAKIQAGERAKGNRQFWGYVWPGAAAESLTCNALEWQVDAGGGGLIEDNGTISVNNPATVSAWLRAKHWVRWISPPSVTAYRETDAASVFDAGNAAFIREWAAEPGKLSSGTDESLTLRQWGTASQLDRIGLAPMPGGSAARVAVFGGIGLAISRYSSHPQQAATLIRFLIQEQLRSMTNGTVRGLTPQAVLYQRNATGSVGPPPRIISRPSAVAALYYERVTRAYAEAVHSVLTGEMPAPKAAAALETQLVQMTGFHAGAPE